MRDLIALTDDEIVERFDEMGYGCECEDLVFTKETIADFAEAKDGYSDYAGIDEGELDTGEAYYVIEKAQAVKGQPRNDIMVVDFGEVRAIYK